MKINLGRFQEDKYIKAVDINRAVLWKTREISLPEQVIQQIKDRGTKTIIFLDHKKNRQYIFDVEQVLTNMKLKRFGQEPQYYFYLDLGKIKSIESGKEVKE